jgi:hypothetical protein
VVGIAVMFAVLVFFILLLAIGMEISDARKALERIAVACERKDPK